MIDVRFVIIVLMVAMSLLGVAVGQKVGMMQEHKRKCFSYELPACKCVDVRGNK